MFINSGGFWKQVNDVFISVLENGSMVWKQVLNAFISVYENGSMLWKQFFGDNAPGIVTKPSIRTTNNSGTGTIYDGPVATSPQYIDQDLFGKDGSYTNYTSISGRKFTYADTVDASTRTTVVNDDRFTSAGGVTTAMRSAVDNKYLFYEVTVSNGTDPLDSIQPTSTPIQMIKKFPDINTYGWTGDEAVGVQLSFNYNLVNYYYNSVEKSYSYVKWWRSTDTNPGGTLIKQESIFSTYTAETSSSLTGVSYYTPTSSDLGYYIVAEIIAVNSWTKYQGYVDNYSLASFPTYGPITGLLSISNGRIEDYYDNRGLDNRSDLPVGTSNGLKATISGVDSNTTYRVRYRMYNWQNATYYNMMTGVSGSASSVWTTYTADSAGVGDISSVTISNGVATLADYFTIDSAYFGSTTFSGGQYRWQVEIELSAIKTGQSRVYWVSPYQSYYIQPASNSTISASPSTVSPNTNTTISGSFTGFPSGTTYPYQYKVDYGDGTNSGWLPANGFAYGTGNPSYSLTKSYTDAGTYTVSVSTIPDYTLTSTTVTVAATPTNTVAPTLTTDTGNFSAGSKITINAGTWTGANSFGYQLLASTTSPVADGSTSKTLTGTNGNEYTITLNDANASSYYFRGIVTGYQNSNKTGLSANASTATSSRSYISPTTTISVATATTSGFTISGTASPAAYTSIDAILIYDSAQSLSTTITTGLPAVNSTNGTWSYTWTGGSSGTTYYAKVRVKSSDSDVTKFTTDFSTSIKTLSAPDAFTFSISSTGTVTTPGTPTITRVSSTSNTVLFELATAFPSDTFQYGVNQSGAGFGTRTGSPAQYVTSLNGFDANGNAVASGGSYDSISTIESGSSSAEMTISTTGYGKTRSASVDVSTSTGASSWAINFSWSGAGTSTVTYYSNDTAYASSSTSSTQTVYTSTMPFKIIDVTGSANPTITINNVTAYSGASQTGATKAGTAGTTVSLSSLARPTSTSSTTTQNYTYYDPNPQAFTINDVSTTNGAATGTPTVDTISYTESTKTVLYTYSVTSGVRYKTIAYGTAYNPDSTQASPSKGPYLTVSTSDSWGYDEAGTVTVGVAATDAIGKASVSWGASTNAGSYIVSYKLGTVSYTSPAQTGTTFSVNTTSQFTLVGVTAYKAADGTGTSKAGTMPTTTIVTPTETYSSYGTKSITVTAFITPAPTAPNSFLFSRNLNGGTSTTRRNWFWNVSTGIGSYSYVIYDLYVWDQSTQPTTTGTTGYTSWLTFGKSTASAPITNANNYNYSGTSTAAYRTMARGSSYQGDNLGAVTASSAISWGKARCNVTGTNGTTYTSGWTAWA